MIKYKEKNTINNFTLNYAKKKTDLCIKVGGFYFE